MQISIENKERRHYYLLKEKTQILKSVNIRYTVACTLYQGTYQWIRYMIYLQRHDTCLSVNEKKKINVDFGCYGGIYTSTHYMQNESC